MVSYYKIEDVIHRSLPVLEYCMASALNIEDVTGEGNHHGVTHNGVQHHMISYHEIENDIHQTTDENKDLSDESKDLYGLLL